MTATRMDPEAPYCAMSVSVSEEHINVLFAGETGNAGRIVDRYDLQGRYEESYLLPEVCHKLSVSSGRLVCLISSPIPSIIVWRKVGD